MAQPKNWEECRIYFPACPSSFEAMLCGKLRIPSVEGSEEAQPKCHTIHLSDRGNCAAQKIEQLSKDMEKATCHRRDLSLSLINMKNWMGELYYWIGLLARS